MSKHSSGNRSHGSSVREIETPGSSSMLDKLHLGGGMSRLALTGLVAVGLGVWAWQFIGPDLRRYLKIRDM